MPSHNELQAMFRMGVNGGHRAYSETMQDKNGTIQLAAIKTADEKFAVIRKTLSKNAPGPSFYALKSGTTSHEASKMINEFSRQARVKAEDAKAAEQAKQAEADASAQNKNSFLQRLKKTLG